MERPLPCLTTLSDQTSPLPLPTCSFPLSLCVFLSSFLHRFRAFHVHWKCKSDNATHPGGSLGRRGHRPTHQPSKPRRDPVSPPLPPRPARGHSSSCLAGEGGKKNEKSTRSLEKKNLSQSSPLLFSSITTSLPLPPFIMKFAAFALAAFVAVAAAQVSQSGRKRAGGRGARRRRDLARALAFNSASFFGAPAAYLAPAPRPIGPHHATVRHVSRAWGARSGSGSGRATAGAAFFFESPPASGLALASRAQFAPLSPPPGLHPPPPTPHPARWAHPPPLVGGEIGGAGGRGGS